MPNLFSRVTGSAWSRVTATETREPVTPQLRASPAPRPAAPAPAPAPRRHRLPLSLPPPQPTYTAQPAAASHAAPPVQPRLSGLDPKDRLATSRAEEDLLDIPAFLRRQAN